MTWARGRANHELYLARIVLAAWREALARQEVPASILAQAFLDGVREHLAAAYGWFLLEVSRVEPLPDYPPRCCAELPPPPEGKVSPGEVQEFQQLEKRGWLRDMLQGRRAVPHPVRQHNNLAVATTDEVGPEQVDQWLQQLECAFERMADSLDEY